MTPSDQKEIWSDQYTDKENYIKVFKRIDGILIIQAKGIIDEEKLYRVYEYFQEYVKNTNTKIRLLTVNTKLNTISPNAKKVTIKFTDKDSPISKIATIEDNFFLRSFIKLYSLIITGNTKVNSFKTKEKAINWLNQ